MEWLEKIGSGVLGVLGGGVTGLFGVVAQRYFDLKKLDKDLEAQRDRNAHEIAKMEAEGRLMEKEYAARTQIALSEAEGKAAVADASTLAASFDTEPKRYSDPTRADKTQNWLLVILDFIRGLVRPGLTMYLCAVTTLIYIDAHLSLQGKNVSPEQAMEVMKLVIETVLYLTTTCTAWWFGTRNRQPVPKSKG